MEPFGDLIVAGGTNFGPPTLTGPTLTFGFNPRLVTAGGLTPQSAPLYPGQVGCWVRGPDLEDGRFYPTTTMTAQLNRTGGKEVMLVLGGSIDDYDPNPVVNHTWNTYEGLVIQGEVLLSSANFTKDVVFGAQTFAGPGTPGGPVHDDWLEDYPRCHLLSSGQVLFSGYAPRWAQVDHDTNPGVWSRQAAPPYSSTAWQHPRHDGTSLLFPNVGGLQDLVVRMGGSDEVNYVPTSPFGTTDSIEAYVANGPGTGNWVNAGTLPNPQPGTLPSGRYLMNVVILPDASLLVLGGVARPPGGGNVPVNQPLLYKNGVWSVLPANTLGALPSIRDYHSAAVLLPDGRVMLGGGNNRNYDYEIFSPAYMSLPKPQSVTFDSALPYDSAMSAYEVGYQTTVRVECEDLPLGETIQSVVLMAPGATTHHFDMSQRYVELVIKKIKPHIVEFSSPATDKYAPRGIYMLFLVTSTGAVSDAQWVVLR